MAIKEPIFCSLAFGSASINSYGEFIPCCAIRTSKFKMIKDGHYDYGILKSDPHIRINATNLKEVRRSLLNGEFPEVCYNCKEAEENNIASMRTIWNRELTKYNIPLTETIDPKDIRYLDLTFSTKCNSKCMTCSSDLSEFWTEEWNNIWRIKPEQQKIINRVCINETLAEKIVNDFPNLMSISIIGGEPTISEEHIYFLKLLIQRNKSKNIKLQYVTNLTGITDELIEIWQNFNAVHVSVSIDGYGKVNEYIRYPFKWSKIESNLRKFLSMTQNSVVNNDNTTRFTIGLSCTISLYNAIQCMDLFDFWLKLLLEYKKPDGTLAHDVGCFVNRVTSPQYALVNLLSLEYRKTGIEKGEKLLSYVEEYLEKNPNETINQGFIDSVKIVMKWLEEPMLVNSIYLSQSKHFITESDSFRDRNIKDYIPELYTELEKIYKEGIIPELFYLPGQKQKPVVNQLIDGPGYFVTELIIPIFYLNSIYKKYNSCYPVRASSKDKKYAEKDNIKNLPDISVWWSQSVMDWPEVQKIAEILNPHILKFLPTAKFYASDIVTINEKSNWISPHVDTPHRFRKYNYNRELLGIQVIVPLYNIDSETASTGIVPHSQQLDFDINLCYSGHYNEYFLKNVVQPPLNKGSALIYNCRLLHSSMPNPQNKPRPALLINFLEESLIEEVTKIDNVWTSNNG